MCGPRTESKTARTRNKLNAEQKAKGDKVIFGGGRKWLHRFHPYRSNLQFNGEVEERSPPRRMSAQETICCAQQRDTYLRGGGPDGGPHDLVHLNGVKRLPGLYQLDYWQVRNCNSITGSMGLLDLLRLVVIGESPVHKVHPSLISLSSYELFHSDTPVNVLMCRSC
jgi:hypothetical protein